MFFEECKVGDLEKICKIVDDGINPTMVVRSNFFDEVPLHWACRLVLAITIITIVRELYGTTGFVMMMIMVRFGHLEVVRYLIGVWMLSLTKGHPWLDTTALCSCVSIATVRKKVAILVLDHEYYSHCTMLFSLNNYAYFSDLVI